MKDQALVKTHLIIKDIHEEYSVKWRGNIAESKPAFKNDKLIFIIVGGRGRVEVNSNNMLEIENRAKKMTQPRGREAVTTDKAYIYLKEEDGNEKLVCVVRHNHVKTYAPMYDRVDYI
jgi:hypothetical protein